MNNNHVKVNAFNPMICAYYNADFDGDALSISFLSSQEAKEDAQKMKIYSNIKKYFDPDSFIIEFTHESVYAMHHISKYVSETYDENEEAIKSFNDFKSVKIKSSEINNLLNKPVYIKSIDQKVPYFTALLNKTFWQLETREYINEFLIFKNQHYTKKDLNPGIMNLLLKNSIDNKDFVNRLWKINTLLNELSTANNIGVASFELDDFTIEIEEADNIKNNFVTEPVLGFHQNMYLFKRIVIPYLESKKSGQNILNKVFKSGSRLKAVQLMKSTASVGIPTDVYGKAINKNISKSLLEGLNPEELFTIANGARMALAARESLIPKSGEMQRIIMNSLGFIILDFSKEDCGDAEGFRITVKDKKHLKSLQGRVVAKAPENLNLPENYIISKDDEFLIRQEIHIFSPITCKHEGFKICKKCWGEHAPNPSKNNISYVGPLAASAIVEQLLQSGLRLHHTGGSWQMEHIDEKLLDIIGRSEIYPEIINGNNITVVKMADEDFKYYKSILDRIYEPGGYEVVEEDDKKLIIVHQNLANQDSSKVIKNFSNIIYKQRKKESEDFKSPEQLYSEAVDIVFEGAYLLSVYLEVILSALFYNDEMVAYRYLDDKSEVSQQISLKNVLNSLDPKLSIFHKLSNNSLMKLYENDSQYELDHFMFELLRFFK